MDGIGTMYHSLPECLYVIATQPLDVSIGNYRSGIVAYHAVSVPRTCPFRQEAALLVSIDKPDLHLLVHRRIDKVKQWEERPESVPEACIGKQIAGKHLTVVRTVVDNAALRVNLVE